jgi:branched-chain amino acid transport system ATP-binding protein
MPDPAGTALLELRSVCKSFGRVVVADNLSLVIGPGDLIGIVGPNGAGKTSLFGLISGDLTPSSGEIIFAGSMVNRLDAAARCRLGIGRTFQVPKPFGAMTVFENVLVAVQQGSGLRRRPSYAAASAVLDRTGLSGDANSPAERLGLLSRKRLEVARALATSPKLLLLDEVAGGLTDPEVEQLVQIVRAIRDEGIAVVWIEHVVHALTAAVHRLLCLAGGTVIGDGEPDEVLALPVVREVFLGTEVTASLHEPDSAAARESGTAGVDWPAGQSRTEGVDWPAGQSRTEGVDWPAGQSRTEGVDWPVGDDLGRAGGQAQDGR